MLTEIIKNPLETPNGYTNPIKGIALRGPLSQFFSALYLKPLDDALSKMEVTYCRYQDDILVLCKTKRQLNRCKRRMMTILQERRLTLSRKKSRMGTIKHGFHFLGVHYLPTQPEDHTIQQHDSFNLKVQPRRAQLLSDRRGVSSFQAQSLRLLCNCFLMRGHCVKHASKSNAWSPMGYLPKRSEFICLAGYNGGQKQTILGPDRI